MALGRFEPSSFSDGLGNLPTSTDPYGIQQQAVEAAQKKAASKTTRQRFEEANAKALKYKKKYQSCKSWLDSQGLDAYPADTPWSQTKTCKKDYKKWKEHEKEAAKYAAQLTFKDKAQQQAALGAAAQAADSASSEGEAADKFTAWLRANYGNQAQPQAQLTAAMVQPRMSARREHADSVRRAKHRAKRKGRPEAEELASVPPIENYMSDSDPLDDGFLSGFDWEDYQLPILAVGGIAVAGGIYWAFFRKKRP